MAGFFAICRKSTCASQSLVGGEVWDAAKRRGRIVHLRQAVLVDNMYAAVDFSVTPRPMTYGRWSQAARCLTHPAELRDELQRELGPFPRFRFWAPTADIESTRWIGRSALRIFERQLPTLTLVYLPHLDYNLQRFGPGFPGIARDVAAVDEVCGELIAAAERAGAAVVVLSEYGITEVSNPIHVNRALRSAGWLRVREEQGREQLDPAHPTSLPWPIIQIAHVYVARPELIGEVAQMLRSLPVSSGCWTRKANARSASTIRARAS
jgi:predicted AlkP superfamily pyrophosphatase or phosphodiesterase